MTNSKNLVEDDEPTIEDSNFEINSMAEYQKNMKEIKVAKIETFDNKISKLKGV